MVGFASELTVSQCLLGCSLTNRETDRQTSYKENIQLDNVGNYLLISLFCNCYGTTFFCFPSVCK